MGDIRDWLPESRMGILEDKLVVAPSCHRTINVGVCDLAEEETQQIIAQIQPTVMSEKRRENIIHYVQRLIKESLCCEVFPFGSVPLKTYLPDGDIDLTVFGGINVEDALVTDVFSILENEAKNTIAKFVVKDVQLIRAEVKLVKCLVQNVVVDISFNQLGGLCTLCFLEKVDCLIGKDHLFKRSIILIKAWCYYESRILGAHHGLISTYALETLVLYIFHLFHSSLNGPLGVLYKFLDYFSKFDWEHYCISLNGPIPISSLPEIIVEKPENDGDDLFLSNEFIKECVENFSISSSGMETNSRSLSQKHLNIVDPLKENNNLGRSVTKGNFYRIRSAFTYGARKLFGILSGPEESISDEVCKFFSNTLERHGSGQRPDVQDPFPFSVCNGFGPVLSSSGGEALLENMGAFESNSVNAGSMNGECRVPLCNEVKNMSGAERRLKIDEHDAVKVSLSTVFPVPDSLASGAVVSGHRLSGDAQELATSRSQNFTISNGTPKCSSSGKESIRPLRRPFHAPHLYLSYSHKGNRETETGSSDQYHPEDTGFTDKKVLLGSLLTPTAEKCITENNHSDENKLVSNCEMLSIVGSKSDSLNGSSVAWSSKDFHHSFSSFGVPTSISESPEALNTLSDLSGDYTSHLNSLGYGRWCFEYAKNVIIPPVSRLLLSQFKRSPWDACMPLNRHGVGPPPPFYPFNTPLIPAAPFGFEESPKPRGTGLYFPNVNHYNDRHFPARGRGNAPVRSPRGDGRPGTSMDMPFSERSGRWLPHHHLADNQGVTKKSGNSDLQQSSSLRRTAPYNANGSSHPPERSVEVGSLSSSGMTPECSMQLNTISSSSPQNPRGTLPTSVMQKTKQELSVEQNRIHSQSYQLKDEDDFPPLSS